jgi:hypothetical protein
MGDGESQKLDARFLLSIKFAPMTKNAGHHVRDLLFVIVSSFVIRISVFEQSLVSQHTQPNEAQTTIVMKRK